MEWKMRESKPGCRLEKMRWRMRERERNRKRGAEKGMEYKVGKGK